MFLVYADITVKPTKLLFKIDKPFTGKCSRCFNEKVRVVYGHYGCAKWCFSCMKNQYSIDTNNSLKRFFNLEKAQEYCKTQEVLERL